MNATPESDDSTLRHPADAEATVHASSAASVDAAGASFGRYRLLSELGRGGMGVVWKAWDPQLERAVALKRILAVGDVALGERFLGEARAAARLRHPAIAAVHDVGSIDGQSFFTVDFIEGRSLDRVAKPLPEREALALVKAVAEALGYAHQEGIVHRDVKPANILVDPSGRPFVVDFGLAKDVRREDGLTRTGDVLGTPAYMSPEQAGGEAVGPAGDQFSLGAVLYELLTGRRPFEGERLVNLLNAVIQADRAEEGGAPEGRRLPRAGEGGRAGVRGCGGSGQEPRRRVAARRPALG